MGALRKSLWTLVMVFVWEFASADALSISLTLPRTELKEEYFENRRYQPRGNIGTKSRPRREPTAESVIAETLPTPAPTPTEQLKTLPQLEEPSVAMPGHQGGLQGFLFGGDPSEIYEFKKHLDDMDLRKNSFELSLASSWIQYQSSGTSWGREAQSKGMGFGVEACYWVSPLLGVVGSYRGSLSGTIQKQFGSDETVPLNQSWLGLGIRFRRFFGSHKKMSSFAWGIDGRQRDLRTSSAESEKFNTRSRAAFLVAEGRIPMTARWVATVQMALAPWVDHQESGGRSGDFSGVDATSTSYSLGLGMEYVFDRGHRFFLKAKGDIEANQFQRSSGLIDPRTGLVSRGVSVSQSFFVLELGYIWGN